MSIYKLFRNLILGGLVFLILWVASLIADFPSTEENQLILVSFVLLGMLIIVIGVLGPIILTIEYALSRYITAWILKEKIPNITSQQFWQSENHPSVIWGMSPNSKRWWRKFILQNFVIFYNEIGDKDV